MIPETKWKQYGLPNMEVKGIVIHNTNSIKSAAQLEKYMENGVTSQGCHFFVDHNEVRQVMPLDWSVWNTGMGYDFGNLHCIAVEICTNPNKSLYLQGQSKAIDLIERLLGEFNLTKSNVYFHRDFNPYVNCPSQIPNKNYFLSQIKERK